MINIDCNLKLFSPIMLNRAYPANIVIKLANKNPKTPVITATKI